MTDQEKLWAKRRAKAAKLSGPKPVELPSHSWRCQVMVDAISRLEKERCRLQRYEAMRRCGSTGFLAS